MPTLADVLRQTGYAQDGTLATPTPTESPMTKVLAEHIKSIPQKFAQNQQAQMDLLGKAFPGNTYESMMTQGDPKALAELAMQAPFNAMIAYHGTPHKIVGNFDINKVGTGEGAQHFGHGIYFAEEPTVAAGYTGRTVLVEPKLEKFTFNGPDYKIENGKYYKGNERISKSQYERAFEGITDLFNSQNKGNMYKVDIPDTEIPHYMDWYQKLDEQTPQVKKALGIPENEFENFKIPQTGTNYSFSPKMSGQDLYHELTSIMGSKKEASRVLNEIGVKGNRYENFQVKKGRGADTYNYVSFDPSTVKILEENSKPVSRKALIEEQVNKLKD